MISADRVTAPGPPSLRTKRRPPVRRGTVQHADRGQDGPHSATVELLVLRGERVDRWRDDPHLLTGHPRWHVLRREKTYPSAAARCGRKKPHAARVASFSQSTPIWQRHATRAPALASTAGQPRGLRIVQQHQITRPYPVQQLDRVGGQYLRVMPGLAVAQRATGGLAMDLVVQPLGDHEELGITGDNHPAGSGCPDRARTRPAPATSPPLPPPTAVELTFQMVRPASRPRNSSAARTSRACRSSPITGLSRATGRDATFTDSTRLTFSSPPQQPTVVASPKQHRSTATLNGIGSPPTVDLLLTRGSQHVTVVATEPLTSQNTSSRELTLIPPSAR